MRGLCPTTAIVSGDLEDPESPVRALIDVVEPAVRAPQQGTGPNVFYLGAHEAALNPLMVSGGDAFLYSEVPEAQAEKLAPLAGEAVARAMHDVAHPAPWGWRVSSYFLTKGVAAGAMMLALGSSLVAGLVALLGIAATGAFLVADLKRPERFHHLFFMPQWRSWLAIGAQVLNAAALVALAYTVCVALGADGPRDVLRWVMVPAGALLAMYTAFLFGQCEGRDLWQSRLLAPHTLVNALVAGAAVFALLGEGDPAVWLTVGAAASASLSLADAYRPHPTGQARQAARNLLALRGFAIGVALLVLAAALAFVVAPLAGVCALAGLWLYEHAWVRAGQSVPLS